MFDSLLFKLKWRLERKIKKTAEIVKMLYNELEVRFMKREVITLEELQNIIEVIQEYDYGKSPKEQENKLDDRIATLIETGHVKKYNGGNGSPYFSYRNFTLYENKDILIIKKMTIKVQKKNSLNISDKLKSPNNFNILFNNLIFEPRKGFFSADLSINFPSAVKIAFIKNKFKQIYVNMNMLHKERHSFIDIIRSKFSQKLDIKVSVKEVNTSFPNHIYLKKNLFIEDLYISSYNVKKKTSKYNNTYTIRLINNRIRNFLSIANIDGTDCKLVCDSGNRINRLGINGETPEVWSWGLKEKIKSKYFTEDTREIFVKFKQQALDKEHKLHESIFQHHINQCDAELVKLKPFFSSWQERIIMWLARITSNYGTSLWLPAFWLFVVNFTISCVVALKLETVSFEYIYYIAFELFQPFKTVNGIVAEITEIDEVNPHDSWLSFLTLVSKLFYAICAYEFIRAARRFTPR